MEMVDSNDSAVPAVPTAFPTLMLCLPPYHCHLARRLQPFHLDLALSAVAPVFVILQLNICIILYRRAVTLNNLEITASKECSYLL